MYLVADRILVNAVNHGLKSPWDRESGTRQAPPPLNVKVCDSNNQSVEDENHRVDQVPAVVPDAASNTSAPLDDEITIFAAIVDAPEDDELSVSGPRTKLLAVVPKGAAKWSREDDDTRATGKQKKLN
ncbi:hypothetical protein R6Q59_017476 [Mikania micrantha]